MKTPARNWWRENEWYSADLSKRWYTDIGHKTAIRKAVKLRKDTTDKEATSILNQILGINMKQICLSLSDGAASLRRAPLVDALGRKPLSSISPLTASRWVSSRGTYWRIQWSLYSVMMFGNNFCNLDWILLLWFIQIHAKTKFEDFFRIVARKSMIRRVLDHSCYMIDKFLIHLLQS